MQVLLVHLRLMQVLAVHLRLMQVLPVHLRLMQVLPVPLRLMQVLPVPLRLMQVLVITALLCQERSRRYPLRPLEGCISPLPLLPALTIGVWVGVQPTLVPDVQCAHGGQPASRGEFEPPLREGEHCCCLLVGHCCCCLPFILLLLLIRLSFIHMIPPFPLLSRGCWPRQLILLIVQHLCLPVVGRMGAGSLNVPNNCRVEGAI